MEKLNQGAVTLIFDNCKLVFPKKINWFNKLMFKFLGFREAKEKAKIMLPKLKETYKTREYNDYRRKREELMRGCNLWKKYVEH